MGKQKTHQGIKKRFKKTRPKRRKYRLVRQTKGRGSKHLKTKQSSKRKRRVRRKKSKEPGKYLKKATKAL